MHDRSRAESVPLTQQSAAFAEELTYRLRQQQLAAEFGLYALKTHDIPALLQEATRICALGMHAEFCKVMHYQPEAGDFLLQAGVGWKLGYVGNARAGADLESPAGYAFQTGRPVISNHLQGETRFRTPKILADHNIKRAINVLLQLNGEKYGVLEVDSPNEQLFAEADLAFMQGFANLLGVALERQHSEQILRTRELQLSEALEHQDVMTKEVSHRVKNSLSMVASLLHLQGRSSGNAEVQRALADAESRVHTVAAVHDRLWRTNEVHNVDLADFIGGLCSQFSVSGTGNGATFDVDAASISTDDAIPLGLLVNELLTNAMKYAPPEKPGDVHASLKAIGRGLLRLEVRDRGDGQAAALGTEKPTSLGMKLIARLGRQLGSAPKWEDANPGTRFVLEFMPSAAA
jgi:two-component sensor histidine kinase